MVDELAKDKTLSESLIKTADALKHWEEVAPLTTQLKNLVTEYSELIDNFGKLFTVVGFIWDAYADMEKAKQEAAQQQAMVSKIIDAVGVMVKRAVNEIKQHIHEQEVREAVSKAEGIEEAFRLNVLPHAKTYPLTGFDGVSLDVLRNDAQVAITVLYRLLEHRADIGDGPAMMILYRNLHTLVQCKLMMDRWRFGLTRANVQVAEEQTMSVVNVFAKVLFGYRRMSDASFSQGIVHFRSGGGGRPVFERYSYFYRGEIQPVKGSNLAPVAQAFSEARKEARENAVPQEVKGWAAKAYKTVEKLRELKEKVPE